MNSSLLVLGRQPALGLAELESLFGSSKLQPIGNKVALLEVDPKDLYLQRLGGSLKAAKLLTILPTTDWSELEKYLIETLPKHLGYIPNGKIRFGLNAIDLRVGPQQINRTTLTIKKVIKAAGRSVRVVPNVEVELNTAQTIHNQLIGPTGMELVLVRYGKTTILAQVIDVQNIEAYAARDQARPKRDSKVGMLPPKLAQIIINLAADSTNQETLIDPFCGTGVILQEALLMGFSVLGSDLDQRMVDYTQANLDWLVKSLKIKHHNYSVSKADATSLKLQTEAVIASETYLGRPLSSLPDTETLAKIISDVGTIHQKFLQNVAKQTKSGFRMALAVPAWRIGNNFKRLPVIANLTDMGYTRVKFVHARNEDLIYHRPGQIVGRELVTLIRK